MTLLGLLVLLTTSPMINSFPGQLIAVPLPIPVYHPKPVAGSIFLLLAQAFIAFGILLRPSTTNKPPPECPSGYTLNKTECGLFCHRLESQSCRSFLSARRACQAEGADFLVPDVCSFPLFRDLTNQTRGQCQNKDYWVGVFRKLPAFNYVTVQGVDLPDNFKFWGAKQPSRDMDSTGVEQSCVLIDSGFGNLLNDFSCILEVGYICQKFL